MVGLAFRFDFWDKNIFKTLFANVDASTWVFKLKYWESFGSVRGGGTTDFNQEEDCPSDVIKQKLLFDITEISPEFVEMFISKGNPIQSEIVTYQDFMESSYFLSLTIIDHRILEICCKDEDLLKVIEQNFTSSPLSGKEVVELDMINPRAKLSVWRQQEDIGIYDYHYGK